MEATLQAIFLIGFAAYQAHHPLPGYIHKAAWSLMNCRTAVMRDLFRGKVRAAILALLEEKKLLLPEGMSAQQVKNLLNQLGRKKWNARIQEKYSHGQGVVSYLARYLRGGPIANGRIVRVNEEEVVFNRGREQRELLSLSIEEFISRYLQHVLPPHFIAVRYWGLYSNSAQQRAYAKCREALGQKAPPAGLEAMQLDGFCDPS